MGEMPDNKYTVYKHTAPNGKIYIGMTGRELASRWCNGKGYKRNKHFDQAIKKYGWENIKHEIVKDGLTKDDAAELEKKTIALYETTNPDKGYNLSIGGLGGTLGVKMSDETLRRMSIARTGPGNPRYGIKISKEESAKLSSLRKGRWSERQEAVLRRCQEENKKKVVCLDNCVVFDSVMEACKYANVDNKGVSNVCNGQYYKSGGLHWSFYNGESDDEIHEKLKEVIEKETEAKKNKSRSWSGRPRSIICVETGETFQSSKSAGEYYGVSYKAINKVIGLPNRTSHGLHWVYTDGERGGH